MLKVTISIHAEGASPKKIRKAVTKAVASILDEKMEAGSKFFEDKGVRVDMTVTGKKTTKEEKEAFKAAKRVEKAAVKKVKKACAKK